MSYTVLARTEHRMFCEFRKRKLKNKNPTVISSNCNGAIMLHDLGCRFNSPTVNLYIEAEDFIKLLDEPKKYFSEELVEVESEKPFPVGKILDLTIYFMHYKSFEEAKSKWYERIKRMDYNNLFIMMSDKNNCSYELLERFDKLPYKHKVVFTHKPYPEFKSACYIKGFENEKEVGVLSDWRPGFFKRRYLDSFDSVAFLNGETY